MKGMGFWATAKHRDRTEAQEIFNARGGSIEPTKEKALVDCFEGNCCIVWFVKDGTIMWPV